MLFFTQKMWQSKLLMHYTSGKIENTHSQPPRWLAVSSYACIGFYPAQQPTILKLRALTATLNRAQRIFIANNVVLLKTEQCHIQNGQDDQDNYGAATEPAQLFPVPGGQNKKDRHKPVLIIVLCSLDGAFNLVGTETSSTDIYMARSTIDNRLDTLYIGLPHSVAASVGVRNLNAERHALAANIALSH